MGSLEVLEVPQNGIKKDGMVALMEALKANAQSLRELHLNDNWVKAEAVEGLATFILASQKLERLNISDSTMGTEGVVLVVKAFAASPSAATLKHFASNYNEVESAKASILILETLLEAGKALEIVEFRGNTLGRKAAAEMAAMFEARGCKLFVFEEEDEEDEEAEEEEEEEDEFDMDKIVERLEKLSL